MATIVKHLAGKFLILEITSILDGSDGSGWHPQEEDATSSPELFQAVRESVVHHPLR
jgi:hypothetical protein